MKEPSQEEKDIRDVLEILSVFLQYFEFALSYIRSPVLFGKKRDLWESYKEEAMSLKKARKEILSGYFEVKKIRKDLHKIYRKMVRGRFG